MANPGMFIKSYTAEVAIPGRTIVKFGASGGVVPATVATDAAIGITDQLDGAVVTYGAFLDLQQSVSGREGSSYTAVVSTKKNLACRIKGLPVEIKSVYGLGYRLRKLEPEWDWRQEDYK
ncbi:hypothetical protein SAMN05444414_11632 [Roseovarius marisflavi]|uniref:Uncharacterized protein n=1 Tax=Roseovarius marisflavi TaxID=1054996 RepID=A0A1M7B377_9RHOB|nr:hypothetical protein [Roseovarius marisflavi]SHL49374.1 hypothetical protein SAMN05444414_11632 [Roseovarius marisflavi]